MFQTQNIQMFPNMAPRVPLAPALYVGNLHESVDEQALFEFFNRFGSIHFIRIMRDITTGKSRGYGFVNFVNARDAESAKQYAQYENLNGQAIRIMFKSSNINNESNIVLKNLDKSINEKQLHEYCNDFGSVLSVHIRKFENISMGFVNFSSVPEAQAALETQKSGSFKIGENQVVLEKFISKSERPSKKTLYLENLMFSTEEEVNEWIISAFKKFGEFSSFKAIRSKPNLFSAFLCFKDDKDAETALNEYIGNDKFYIAWHVKKTQRKEELCKRNIYIKNLKPETTSQQVSDILSRYGKVQSIVLRDWESKDKKLRAKFGYILFDKEETAKEVLNKSPEIVNLLSSHAIKRVELFPFQNKKQRQQFLLSTQRAKHYQEMLRFQQYQYQMAGNPYAQHARFNPYVPNQMAFRRPNNGNNQFQVRAPREQIDNARGYQRTERVGNQRGPNHHNVNRPYNAQRVNNQNVNRPQPVQPQPKPVEKKEAVRAVNQTPVPKSEEIFTSLNMRKRLNELMALSDERRRMVFGEVLYPKVLLKTNAGVAPKITGMLIDLDVDDILEIIENPTVFEDRIKEGLEILRDVTAE